MQIYENSKDDSLFLNMLVNGTKRNRINTLKPDSNSECLRKVFKDFEVAALQNETILSNFPEFLNFIEYSLDKSIFAFEKAINGKKD